MNDFAGLDRLLADPARLRIAAFLVSPASHRFDLVREAAGVDATALRRHLHQLRRAGYVETRRDGRRRGWAWLTAEGQARLVGHLKALHALVATVNELVGR